MLFAAVLSFSAIAQIDIDAIEEMNLSVRLSFSIYPTKIAEKSVPDLNTKIYLFPYNTTSQTSYILKTFPNATVDKQGENHYFNFYLRQPEVKRHEFGYSANMNTKRYIPKISEKIEFPQNFSDELVLSNLKSTELFDFEESDLANKAQNLIRGEDNYLKAIFKISKWIRDNVEYRSNNETELEQKSASWVYAHRYGVCDEFAILLTAMLRSVGIPARVVSGIALSSSNVAGLEEWGPHAWTEAYVPSYGWIPIDLTFKEILWLDAAHIKLQHSERYNFPSFKYYWKARVSSFSALPLNFSVNISSYKEGEPLGIRYEVKPLRPSMDFTSYNGINIMVKNQENFYVPLRLQLTMPKDVIIEGKDKHYVLLEPGEIFNKTLLFHIGSEQSLSSMQIYPFSLYANGYIVEKTQVRIANVFPHYERQDFRNYSILNTENVRIDCFPESEETMVEDHIKVKCFVYNDGNQPLQDIICLEERCKPFNLSAKNSSAFDFYYLPYKPGLYKLRGLLKGINKNSEFQFIAYEPPTINLTKKSFPIINNSFGSSELTVRIIPETESPIYNFSMSLYLDEVLLEKWHEDTLSSSIIYGALIKNYLLKNGSNLNVFIKYNDLKGNPYTIRKAFPIEKKPQPFFQKVYSWFMRGMFKVSGFLSTFQNAYESLFK